MKTWKRLYKEELVRIRNEMLSVGRNIARLEILLEEAESAAWLKAAKIKASEKVSIK